MKERTPEQLKGQVKKFANLRNLMPQEVLQIFFMERVLDRLSKSKYASNFILKGGLLISSMVGVNERTTMDIDTTVTGIKMDETEIKKIITEKSGFGSFSFTAADPVDMALELPAADQLRQHILLKGGYGTTVKADPGFKDRQQRRGKHHVADTE